jgi:hypothetical protein
MTYNIFCLSQKGQGHIKNGLPCQDFSCIDSHDNKIFIAAADGLGSCKHSDLGSRAAVKHAIRLLKQGVPIEAAFERTQNHLRKLSSKLMIDVKELSTTLQVAVIDLDNCLVKIGIIGDGGAVVTSKFQDKHTFVFDEYVGQYCNQTQHLFIDNISSAIKIETIEYPVHVSLFTDGLRSMLIEENKKIAFPPFWDSLIKKQKNNPLDEVFFELFNHPFLSKKTDDDLTLASYFSQQQRANP